MYSGPKNKQHSTTHGNAPKDSGPYPRPKTRIQPTHSQHLMATNKGNHETGSGVCFFLTQTRTNKSPFLKSYLHKVDAKSHPYHYAPLYHSHTRHTSSL